MKKTSPPIGEITPAEVAGWFPGGKHARPALEHCQRLAEILELHRVMFNVDPSRQKTLTIRGLVFEVEPARQLSQAAMVAADRLAQAVRAAAELQEHLQIARAKLAAEPSGIMINGVPSAALVLEIDELLRPTESFLFLNRPPKRGRPRADWVRFARQWAPLVADSLRRSGPTGARSLDSDESPVVLVVASALERVFGKQVELAQIGRTLRRR